MRPARFLPLCVLALACLSTHVYSAQDLKNLEREEWMGVYRAGRYKAGYVHRVVERDLFEGRDVYRVEESWRVRMTAGDSRKYKVRISTLYVDEAFCPVFETLIFYGDLPAELAPFPVGEYKRVEARYAADTVECTVESAGAVLKRTVPMPEDTDLTASCMFELGLMELAIGDQIELTRFDLSDFTIKQSTLDVVRRERTRTSSGDVYSAFVVTKNAGKDPPIWLSKSGGIIKQEMPGKDVTIWREPSDWGPAGMEIDVWHPPLIEIDRTIQYTRQVWELEARVTGLADDTYKARRSPIGRIVFWDWDCRLPHNRQLLSTAQKPLAACERKGILQVAFGRPGN